MTHPYDRGALQPEALAILECVFDDACSQHKVERYCEEAKEIALRLLALFNAGMFEEADLRNAILYRTPY